MTDAGAGLSAAGELPNDVYAALGALGIAYTRHDHAPVFTCEDVARELPPDGDAVQTKNLFLRDQRGRRHWLVVTDCARTVDLRRLAPRIAADHLSLGSAERLQRHLGVPPGAVTVLALLNDRAHAVELVVDRDVWRAERLRCHPLVNTATLVLARADLERFLRATGHRPLIIELPLRAPA